MCLSCGGNREVTIDTSVVSEDPSSVRVKLKNETLSLGVEEVDLRLGVMGVKGEIIVPDGVFFILVPYVQSASSSLESGVGMPVGRGTGEESLSTEFLRDEERLLSRMRSGNATNLTIFRVQMSALSSDNPTQVKSGSRTVTSVSSEDTEVPRDDGGLQGLVGVSSSAALGE